MDVIENVVKLLMYEGPDINELIAKALMEDSKVNIDENDTMKVLKITWKTAYETTVTDIFTFNDEKALIKQELSINDKTKVIFDKYKEAGEMLEELARNELAVS